MPESIDQVQRALSAYTIERELGSGGMATVYLASDTKHGRKVAIKILHEEVASLLGAERFLQEIKLAATLQHPHILGLIDSGVFENDTGTLAGRPYYVMPFVDGESLRHTLDRERQLPIRDAVRIASQVASALDYAHRHGVIHRDIKPANILLHDGEAIVADFGIALAITAAGGTRLTQSGISIGTPGYMSPEQAAGERSITARSDIYSLGAVSYEMLAGELPFTGPTTQAILARMMTEEPRPLSSQRTSIPAHVASAISRALEKLPADRFASAREFAEAVTDNSSASSTVTVRSDADVTRMRRWLFAMSVVALVFMGLAAWGWLRPTHARPVARYTLVFDSSSAIALPSEYHSRIAISPDGGHLAYIGGIGQRLFVRALNELNGDAIPGTESAVTPFFSPDGQYVGFQDSKGLRIARVEGGMPLSIGDSTHFGAAGASWGSDGFIYIDSWGPTLGGGLLRLEPKPGVHAVAFTRLDTASGERDHVWPCALPNGKGVLFTVVSDVKNSAVRETKYAIALAEIPSGRRRMLIDDAVYATYADHHLVYITSKKTLMAVGFDADAFRITSAPTPVAEGVTVSSNGAADLALSQTGTLVYGSGQPNRELVWITREGKVQPVDLPWRGNFDDPALSPDGKQVALSAVGADGATTVWVRQLEGGSGVVLSSGGGSAEPSWSPDGRSVTFRGSEGITTRRADASNAATRLQLHAPDGLEWPMWSPDGRWLIGVASFSAGKHGDIIGYRLPADTPVDLVATRFPEGSPALSPDGRWLAFTSWESGAAEVYVVPFPNTRNGKWAVSTNGGDVPHWSHSGKEIFFVDGAGNLVAREVNTTPSFSVGRATMLFPMPSVWSVNAGLRPQYAVAPDDRRFLVLRSVTGAQSDQLILVENWFDELAATSAGGHTK